MGPPMRPIPIIPSSIALSAIALTQDQGGVKRGVEANSLDSGMIDGCENILPLGFQGSKQLVVGCRKSIDAIILQFLSDGIEVDPQISQLGNIGFCLRDAFLECIAHMAMVT